MSGSGPSNGMLVTPVNPVANGDGAPFTSQLRARPDALRLGAEDAAVRWTVRVQVPEVWDVVKISVPPDEPVGSVKARALEALYPDAGGPDAFVLKLHGIEVLDEGATVAATGASDGSIFLLTHRRRRPVR
jgi:hypothetical protein